MKHKVVIWAILAVLVVNLFGAALVLHNQTAFCRDNLGYETRILVEDVTSFGFEFGKEQSVSGRIVLQEVVLRYNNALFIHDLSTSSRRQLSGECDYISGFDANRVGDVAWVETKGPDYTPSPGSMWKKYLYFYDGATKQIREFGEVDGFGGMNNRGDIVFVRDNDIFLYYSFMDETRQITDDDLSYKGSLQINDAMDVLWTSQGQYQAYTPYIYRYSTSRDIERINEDPIGEAVYPIMSERNEFNDLYVIWSARLADRKRLFLYSDKRNREEGEESITLLSDPNYNVQDYDMVHDGSYFVWTAAPHAEEGVPEPPEGVDADVFVYARWSNEFVQITDDDLENYQAVIGGNAYLANICYVAADNTGQRLVFCETDSFSQTEFASVTKGVLQQKMNHLGYLLWVDGGPRYSGEPNPEVDIYVSIPTILPSPPSANAGLDLFAEVNSIVTLDGSGSYDAEDASEELLYSWTQVYGAIVSLSGENTYSPSFVAPSAVGDLTFQLTVTDSDGNYDSDSVNVFLWDMSDPDGDADRDGLKNDWELNGLDIEGDGIIDLDLALMGADPLHKDIFLEVDYEEFSSYHTHKLVEGTVEEVIWVFKDAPVANPDMKKGIKIHIDAGPETIMNPSEDFAPGDTWGTGEVWGDLSESNPVPEDPDGFGAGGAVSLALREVMSEHFSPEREPVFHYCLSIHVLGNSPGYGGVAFGSDFVIVWEGDPKNDSCTIVHELGHTLGLGHGGGDSINHKPNYLSIMNYKFGYGLQNWGAHHCKTITYSFVELPPLNEEDLDEAIGLNGPPEIECYVTSWRDANGLRKSDHGINGWLDWNGNSKVDSSTQTDLNKDGNLMILQGYDDWANLQLGKYRIGYLPPPTIGLVLPQNLKMDINEPSEEVIYCLPFDEIDKLPTPFGVDVWYRGPNNLEPGTTGTFEFFIQNTGGENDSYSLVTSTSLEGVDLSGVPTNLYLSSGETKKITISIYISESSELGLTQSLSVVAYSKTIGELLDAATARFTITNTPENSPVADAGGNRILVPTASTEVSTTLDGSSSYDVDGDTLAYSWRGPFGTATGISPTVTLPIGINLITLTVTDNTGLTDFDHLVVIVRDTKTTQPLPTLSIQEAVVFAVVIIIVVLIIALAIWILKSR